VCAKPPPVRFRIPVALVQSAGPIPTVP
jgi:hypothetical protein